MAETAESTGKKKGPLKWYWVAAITLGLALIVAYFMWPASLDAKATYKYDPLTGKPYPTGTTAGFNTNTGTACTS